MTWILLPTNDRLLGSLDMYIVYNAVRYCTIIVCNTWIIAYTFVIPWKCVQAPPKISDSLQWLVNRAISSSRQLKYARLSNFPISIFGWDCTRYLVYFDWFCMSLGLWYTIKVSFVVNLYIKLCALQCWKGIINCLTLSTWGQPRLFCR